MASEFFKVAAVEELPDGKSKSISVGGKEIAVFRIGEEYFAIANECPHYGAELCDGYIRGETVMCPWHGWQFDLKTGKGLTVSGVDVEKFEVKIEDGEIKVSPGE